LSVGVVISRISGILKEVLYAIGDFTDKRERIAFADSSLKSIHFVGLMAGMIVSSKTMPRSSNE
jgi:hypothetical protein